MVHAVVGTVAVVLEPVPSGHVSFAARSSSPTVAPVLPVASAFATSSSAVETSTGTGVTGVALPAWATSSVAAKG